MIQRNPAKSRKNVKTKIRLIGRPDCLCNSAAQALTYTITELIEKVHLVGTTKTQIVSRWIIKHFTNRLSSTKVKVRAGTTPDTHSKK